MKRPITRSNPPSYSGNRGMNKLQYMFESARAYVKGTTLRNVPLFNAIAKVGGLFLEIRRARFYAVHRYREVLAGTLQQI